MADKNLVNVELPWDRYRDDYVLCSFLKDVFYSILISIKCYTIFIVFCEIKKILLKEITNKNFFFLSEKYYIKFEGTNSILFLLL